MKKLSNILHTRHRLLKSVNSEKGEAVVSSDQVRAGLPAKLQQAMETGAVRNYSDMHAHLPVKPSSPKNTLYYTGHRLRKKLLQEMASADYSSSMRTEYNRSRYEVQRSLMLASVLKIKGMGTEAMFLWEKTFIKARRYSLTTEAYECAVYLCYEYAFRRKKTKHYNMMRNARKLLAAVQAEHEASLLYHRIVMLFKDKWYIATAYKPLTKRLSLRISEIAYKYRTHDLYTLHFRTLICHHYASHDSQALLRTCKKYHAYLLSHKHLQQDSRWSEIAIHQMSASLGVRNYAPAIRLAEQNKKYMRPENPNWFSYQESYFQLLMNAGQYMKAKQLYAEVAYSAHRKNMTAQQQDVWKIFLAYLQIALHSSGMISMFKPRQHFTVLTSCKSDKAGLNFLIEAGMLMYMVIQANRTDIDKHGERFRKYVKRHIVKKRLPRHYLFSKMLLLVVRHQHRHPMYVQQLARKYYERLIETTSVRPHDFETNELIRFEKLWQMLMRQLSAHAINAAA